MGDRMTENGRGGCDLVETFDLHEITSLPNFGAPKSNERTGTYSACVMRPECPAALSAPWSAHVPVPIGGAIDWVIVNLCAFRNI